MFYVYVYNIQIYIYIYKYAIHVVFLSKDLILGYLNIIIEYNFLSSKLTTKDSLVKCKNDVEQMASLDVHDNNDRYMMIIMMMLRILLFLCGMLAGVELLSLTLVYELTPGSMMQLTFVKCIVVALLDFVVVVISM